MRTPASRTGLIALAIGAVALAGCASRPPVVAPASDAGVAAPGELALRPLSKGSSDRAVVFVHGLDGDPVGTFTASGAVGSWADLMAGDHEAFAGADPPPLLSSFALYTLDYREVYRSESNIAEAGAQIASVLRRSGLFERHNHVWFVTHSLGGLMIKQALLEYSAQRFDLLLRRVAGVFFLAVPSQGSPFADVASGDLVQLLTSLFGRNHRVITDLRPEMAAAFLMTLERQWDDFLRSRPALGVATPPYTHCAYEIDRTLALARVVPRLYAQDCLDSNSLPVKGTHTGVVKPRSRGSSNYLWVRDEIRNDAYRLRRWPSVSREPAGEPLGDIIRDFQLLHREAPEDSGVLRVSEAITFASTAAEDRAAHLQLQRRNYLGPNVAGFLHDVSVHNSCVTVDAGADARRVVIDVSERLTSCAGSGVPISVCPGVPCPP